MMKECIYCGRWVKRYKTLNKVIILSKNDFRGLMIDEFKNKLEEWLVKTKRYYHLSASELILYRPDIIEEFLSEMWGKDTSWYTIPVIVCNSCYKKYWVKKHPLR